MLKDLTFIACLLLMLCGCTLLGKMADDQCDDGPKVCDNDLASLGLDIDMAIAAAVVDSLREEYKPKTEVEPLHCEEPQRQTCSITQNKCWCESARN